MLSQIMSARPRPTASKITIFMNGRNKLNRQPVGRRARARFDWQLGATYLQRPLRAAPGGRAGDGGPLGRSALRPGEGYHQSPGASWIILPRRRPWGGAVVAVVAMDVTRGSRAAISRWRHAMRCLRSTRIANTSQLARPMTPRSAKCKRLPAAPGRKSLEPEVALIWACVAAAISRADRRFRPTSRAFVLRPLLLRLHRFSRNRKPRPSLAAPSRH
jgi:hypothetical protein